ncbi:MAG: ABC-2 family transporter protein [Spirochaetia bacterium]|nr:ABC-2 family transporter protein [Spirochaetia bacterium]
MISGITRAWQDLPQYGSMVRAAIQSRMEYRGSFIMYILTILGFYGAQIGVVVLMLYKFERIGTWERGQMAFLYSLLVISTGLVSAIFSGFLEFSEFVRQGTFDRVLLRPLSPLLSVLCMRFEPGGFANIVLGVVGFVVANSLTEIRWTFEALLMLILVLTGGVLIQGSIRIITAASAFFTVSNDGMQQLFVFSAREFLLYPVDIYNKPVRFALTFLFPLAFINFYPAHYFLAKDTGMLFHPLFVYLTFPVGIACMMLAIWFWRKAVRHYGSTGS